ncbi:MAG: glycoside hydrolase family 3 C-terminal domain-containing protein [Bacteroidales bacterium]|nr:glycoside hydrolase family 3 C-terminal domain-containing protein [Bacteroidales bacterium]
MKKICFALLTVLCTLPLSAQLRLRSDNVEEILNAMTLEEKATLLVGGGWGSMTAGSMTASDEVTVPGAAGTTRSIPRLGIPRTVLADGPAGLRISPTREGTDETFYCTGFPVGTVMASMWNPDLVEQLTTAMGQEVKEYGVDVLLAPGLNLHRNPLCGRNFEYFSEDPLLSGRTAAAYVKGVQHNGVGVSIKHFAVNNQETNRLQNDARVSVRALRELYLKGFEIAVREADPWTVMSSYNRVNGPFTQQNHELLTTILRDECGFGGIVMTDWGNKAGTVDAVKAGNDLMEPGAQSEIDRIVAGVKDGSIPQEDLDRNVRRMLEYIVRTPRFQGYRFSNKPDLAAHAKQVRAAAPEGMVLLENNGALPLKETGTVALYGIGAYDFIAGGTGSGNVNKAYVRNVAEGFEANGLSVDADIRHWYEAYLNFKKTERQVNRQGGVLLGETVIPEMAVSRAFLEKKAEQTAVAVLVISRNAGEGADRKAADGDWSLTGQEREMLQNLADIYHQAGKRLIVVLNIGGVIETASWKHIPDAVLLAWTPGQEGGLAVADVLCGAANPSGKLPMTFPVAYFDIPSSRNFPSYYERGGRSNVSAVSSNAKTPVKDIDYTDYAEGIWVGYRYFATAGKPVSYPFGYGMSYTTFAYSKPVVKVDKNGNVTAAVTVTNTGSVAGKETVELYVSAPAGGLDKPACELKGFAKTKNLAPGASETLTVTIDPYTLASFNETTSAWETAAGGYNVHFGASSADIRCSAAFKLSRPQSWPVHPVLLPAEPVAEMLSPAR